MKITHTVTLPDGCGIAKRVSKTRRYSHVVISRRSAAFNNSCYSAEYAKNWGAYSWASRFDLAVKAAAKATYGGQFETRVLAVDVKETP